MQSSCVARGNFPRTFETLIELAVAKSGEPPHARPYIALIHKSPGSCWGVSFPDLPGIITAADTLDDALARAAEVLAFAFEDWQPPAPRGLEELRLDGEFVELSEGAVVAAVRPGGGFAGEGGPLASDFQD